MDGSPRRRLGRSSISVSGLRSRRNGVVRHSNLPRRAAVGATRRWSAAPSPSPTATTAIMPMKMSRSGPGSRTIGTSTGEPTRPAEAERRPQQREQGDAEQAAEHEARDRGRAVLGDRQPDGLAAGQPERPEPGDLHRAGDARQRERRGHAERRVGRGHERGGQDQRPDGLGHGRRAQRRRLLGLAGGLDRRRHRGHRGAHRVGAGGRRVDDRPGRDERRLRGLGDEPLARGERPTAGRAAGPANPSRTSATR